MRAERPAVTVVVLTWQREGLLRETVESVLAQTFGNIEVLIVDNESTDGTRQWATTHPDVRVRYLCHANGGNISVNRNYAVSHARGGHVAFCDDDDLWMPEKLERQMAALRYHPECAICCTNAMLFSAEGEIGSYVRGRSSSTMPFADLLVGWHDVIISTTLAAREVFEDTGQFSEDPRLFSVEDYEYWIRAAKRFGIWYLDESLVRYRVHEGRASHLDMRRILDRQEYVFSQLAVSGVITPEEEALARRNLRRNRRVARVKEAVKRVPLVMPAWYAVRRSIHAVMGRVRAR